MTLIGYTMMCESHAPAATPGHAPPLGLVAECLLAARHHPLPDNARFLPAS